MALDDHTLQPEQTGAIVPGRVHQLQKSPDNRPGQQAHKTTVHGACECLLQQFDQQAGNPLSGLEGYIAHETVTHYNIGDIAKKVTSLDITDVVDGVALGQHV